MQRIRREFTAGVVCYDIQPMSAHDAEEVAGFFHNFSEVRFCAWENANLLRETSKSPNSVCLVVRADSPGTPIVGALIGGILGVRATINHLAVHPDHRRRGIARQLAELALARFLSRGVRRAFLFVVDEAISAKGFWANIGFRPTINETTCEMDLLSPFDESREGVRHMNNSGGP